MIVIDNDTITIHVVDAIMGAGKTQACIRWMQQHPERRYMYVTPYLDECKRIQTAAPELDFMEPQEGKTKSGTKSSDLLSLLSEGKNITTTHELFTLMNDSYIQYIKKFKYILMLDEELTCIESIQIPRSDLALMISKHIIEVDPATKAVKWICPDDYTGKLAEYKNDIQRKPLHMVDGNALMWLFNLDILQAFDSVYVLTFMFASSMMAAYLEKNHIGVDYFHVVSDNGSYSFAPKYQAVPAKDKEKLKGLIKIHDSALNTSWIPQRQKKDDRNLMSKGWFKKASKKQINQLKNNAYNFVRHYCKAKKDDVLWTSYKDYASKLESDRLTFTSKKQNWIAWNTKATNQYHNRKVLVYLLNVFPVEPIRRYLEKDSSVKLNVDDFALSAMLQWVWRSAVRKGQKVIIYIPAPRMRRLLIEWLNG